MPPFINKTISVLFLSLAMMGCTKERVDITYQGLDTINELDNLKPSLAAVVDPEFFAPWIEGENHRPLTEKERLALESSLNHLFTPDELGRNMVASQFSLFTQDLRPRLEKWILRSDRHMAIVQKMFNQSKLPPELSYLPFVESGYSPKALSHSGASGLWQFMPDTGRRYGLACCQKVDERNDPVKATLAAAAYLRMLYLKFGDWSLALASYNAGEGKISHLVKLTGAKDFFELARLNDTVPHRYRLRQETLLYVPRFIAITKIMKNLGQLGFNLPDWYAYNQEISRFN